MPSSPAPDSCHPDEWQARVELAACYRIFAMLGWSELIYNHITVRLPDSSASAKPQFLINPFGLHFTEVTARNLVKINLQGEKVDGSEYPVNPAGFALHAAIHAALPEAHCVMHTHTTAGMAVACTQTGLAQNNFYSAQLHGMVAYHDFEGITIDPPQAQRLVQALGQHPLMLLRNHGLLAQGPTLALTFVRLWTLQRACEVQIAQATLGPAIAVPHPVAQATTRQSIEFDSQFGAGQDVLDALIRQLDRFDDSYKQ
jgi:ribulose-5-phosphate 4-epimerase/fuculose-1-phosphate aldolase